jgi:hypothetical protein
MRWETWKERHPNTLVVSENTGHDRRYDEYPYSTYEVNDFLLFPLPRPLDSRIPMKERVFGIPSENGGMALPFSEMHRTRALAVIPTRLDEQEYAILWDGEAETAAASLPITRMAFGSPFSSTGTTSWTARPKAGGMSKEERQAAR